MRIRKPPPEDLVIRLRRLRVQAFILVGLAIGWCAIAAFHAFYLADATVQAIEVNAYLPDPLRAFGELPAWIAIAIAACNAASAGATVQFTRGRLLGFASVEHFHIETLLRALTTVSFIAALIYAVGAMGLLYYFSLAPSGR